jgi:uncharacterized lipoprotein YajG
MRFFSSLAIAALMLAACTTPQAAQQAAQPAPGASAAAVDPTAKICYSREVTGSRMPVRECHTRQEWADIQSHGDDDYSLETTRHASQAGGN